MERDPRDPAAPKRSIDNSPMDRNSPIEITGTRLQPFRTRRLDKPWQLTRLYESRSAIRESLLRFHEDDLRVPDKSFFYTRGSYGTMAKERPERTDRG